MNFDGLTTTQKMVLIVLADHVNDVASCFPSIASIAHTSGLKERAVYMALNDLEAAGAIKRESRSADRKSTVYHLLIPVTVEGDWTDEDPLHDVHPLHQMHPSEPVQRRANRTDPLHQMHPKVTDVSKDQMVGTSSLLPTTSAGSGTRVRSKPKRNQPVLDEDPQSVALRDIESTGQPAVPEIRERPRPSGRRDVDPDTGLGLAQYLTKAANQRVPSFGDENILASKIKTWGQDPAVVRLMADVYVASGYHRGARSIWLDFISRREELLRLVEGRVERDQDESNRDDPTRWVW